MQEFKVKAIPQIAPIEFNYEELKKYLIDKVEVYKTIVYTADTIKEAKADRAQLNKMKKSLNDNRIDLEHEYLAPFQDFKAKVNELVGIVDEAARAIDKQVKEYEELQKADKRKKIEDEFAAQMEEIRLNGDIDFSWLKLEQIWNEKWLNVSSTMKSIHEEIFNWTYQIIKDMDMLSRIPEYSFEAIETYKRTLKVEDALWTADNLKQMAEAKADQEAQRKAIEAQEQLAAERTEEFMAKPVEPDMGQSGGPVQVLRFQCYCTMDQAMRLRQFMIDNGIKFERA